jgi:hypothetical protein
MFLVSFIPHTIQGGWKFSEDGWYARQVQKNGSSCIKLLVLKESTTTADKSRLIDIHDGWMGRMTEYDMRLSSHSVLKEYTSAVMQVTNVKSCHGAGRPGNNSGLQRNDRRRTRPQHLIWLASREKLVLVLGSISIRPLCSLAACMHMHRHMTNRPAGTPVGADRVVLICSLA